MGSVERIDRVATETSRPSVTTARTRKAQLLHEPLGLVHALV
jgi:hypothetical protein